MTWVPGGSPRRFEQRARFVEWPRDVIGAVLAAECRTRLRAVVALVLHWLGELLAFPGLGRLAARHGAAGLLGIAPGEAVFVVRYLTIGMKNRTVVRWSETTSGLRMDENGRLISKISVGDRVLWLTTGDARLVMRQIAKESS